jgi:hypothetical protein
MAIGEIYVNADLAMQAFGLPMAAVMGIEAAWPDRLTAERSAIAEMVHDSRHSRFLQLAANPLGLCLAPRLCVAGIELQCFESGVNQRTISPQFYGPIRWVFGAD